ncbi:MAG: class I SAM-dependent methyltransferase [Methanosphaera sp.]|uniref:class I SAM-dependent methyltransferase n=1 Tax=Methanosphaera sp. TaxID=2666342 RepID=UPI0025F7FFA5|nr:class I SAM-dependent methyltransferase [Methanosphaera sp.]MCI5867861.1 class I SAM-dependent methyltransferase [Methanosphaera sp.]MDD6534871.1 class I SAM-dependent methyltransferase [Methanosphaera sp.]MDY3955331.1 class I SAM-dependent methyltransferase [Methanosphaera sp.]
MANLKQHFNNAAEEYDSQINKTVLCYDDMLDALVNAIPDEKENPRILDLGCGTGNVSLRILEKFPNAKITCFDISDKMIEHAKEKLQDYDVEFVIGDFTIIDIIDKYDVIVSSLALHHIKTDDEKKHMYHHIYEALDEGGVFYNADVIKANSNYNAKLNHKIENEYMQSKQLPEDEMQNYHDKRDDNDHPATLMTHLRLLQEVGFKEIDVIWKYYSNAVYGAAKK